MRTKVKSTNFDKVLNLIGWFALSAEIFCIIKLFFIYFTLN